MTSDTRMLKAFLATACVALWTGAAALADEATTQPTTAPTTQSTKDAEQKDSVKETKPLANPMVTLEIEQGNEPLGKIVLELNAEKAPISVLNFIQYVEDGYYNDTIFHRVMPTFMIQGGGFDTDNKPKQEGMRPPIKNEWRNGLKNNRGTIAMARTQAPDSATTQFFINVVDNTSLDMPRGGAAYAVFGKVVEGMDVVDAIRNTEVGPNPAYGGVKVLPTKMVVVKSATLSGDYDKKAIEAQVEIAAKAEREKAKLEEAKRQKELDEYVVKVEQETGKKIEKTDSGLMYVVLQEGQGDVTPKPTDTVKVHYTGWLLDGKKFDSSVDRGQPIDFRLDQVIPGWTEGVGLMKVGEKRKLIIPWELAYGAAGRPPVIPPKAVLVFDVELIAIK